MWRDVLRPYVLRPPVFDFLASSDFSGDVLVISEKSDDVWKRRPALVGLRERIAMMNSLLSLSSRTAGSHPLPA